MHEKETLERARRIFSAGKTIHDHIMSIHIRQLSLAGKQGGADELTMSQLLAVKATRELGQATITELAEMLGVSAPSASAMAQRLVERGFLSRGRDARDRRKVVVSVAPEADETIKRVEETILGAFVDLVEKIGPEYAQQWCDILDRVKRVLEEKSS
ncbi:MAG: MarR family transcriptional regulator [Desulfobacterales bacterium]|nr:MarR family transcriptional regulator [Desulfobacterales bacterium]